MRFTSIFVAGALAVAASAQTASTVASPAPSQSESASEQCLKACNPSDVECKAHCIAVPSPSDQNANNTTECVAKCPKSDGSADGNVQWGNCVQTCITNNYFVTSSGTPQATGGAVIGGSSASGSGSAAATTAAPVTSTYTSNGSTFVSTHTPTGTAATTQSTTAAPGAAGMVTVNAGAGLLGLLAVVFAL